MMITSTTRTMLVITIMTTMAILIELKFTAEIKTVKIMIVEKMRKEEKAGLLMYEIANETMMN